ncbi:RNA 3'-terminal phosphate cyclase [Candidatus Woesearchaeota archaeon]|nr:RNA 3'-terminal phosphate cyclase [Candidatus Woesearchaeota archaeon]
MIEIDGSYGEGGGQIVRTALALSLLTSKPFRITNIRSGRDKPGLKAQHVHAIKAAQQLSDASVSGAVEGNKELEFHPRTFTAKKLSIDIGTAGSITLLLQALLPAIIFGPKRCTLEISGGTDVAWSCPADYYANILLPTLERYAHIGFAIKKRGFYPKGGGQCTLTIEPLHPLGAQAPPLVLDTQGTLVKINGVAVASKSLAGHEVAERMAQSARDLLTNQYKIPIDIRTEYADTFSDGCTITLWAVCSPTQDVTPHTRRLIGADVLGEKGIPAETIGREAAQKLIKTLDSGAAVDEHLADNLIPFLGLCGGTIKTSTITPHTTTNMFVVEKFLPVKFHVQGNVITAEKN